MSTEKQSQGQLGKEVLLSAADVAELANVTAATIQSYFHKGYMPQPDVTVGVKRARMHAWRRETIDNWLAQRPGQGRKSQ